METKQTAPLDPATRYGLVILAVAQGYALYFLHLALDAQAWPATDLRWLKGFYTLAIALPAFFYLGVDRIREKRNAVAAVGLGAALFLLGWHLGWVESVKGLTQHQRLGFTFPFAFSLAVTLFILAFFYRAWSATGRWRSDYHQLLTLSWQQALTLGLLGLFVGVFWLLLWLWGGLFSAIGVHFFKELFDEPAFVYPVTWLVLGLGLVMIRNRIRLIATVQFMCEALIKALLPLAALIVVLFLVTLPFTGLQPVWDTGSAAFMMMALTLVLLFFFNAVLSDNPHQPPYPLPLRWFVMAAVVLLPVTTLLATWALWLRIDQYGLTPDRLWAGVILLLTAAYTFTYAVLIARKRSASIFAVQAANTWLALVIAGVLVLINTPLADLRDWSAQSQKARLLSGEVDPSEFDYAYLRFSLGAYGVRALEAIKESDLAKENPEVAKRVDATLKQEYRHSEAPIADKNDPAAITALLTIQPEDAELPGELAKLIAEQQSSCLGGSNRCQAVELADADGGADWLVSQDHARGFRNGAAYAMTGGRWLKMGQFHTTNCSEPGKADAQSLTRIPGPFLAYTQGDCIYAVSPDPAYLKRLRGTPPGPEE